MKPTYHLKFYADCPDGSRNKFFCYPVHDGKHACDLISRFQAKGVQLRAAFLGEPGALGAALPSTVIQWPGSVATISLMLMKYPARVAAAVLPTSAELDQLAAQFPGLQAALGRLRSAS